MNLKTEIIALAVRALSDKTDLIRTPDTFEDFFAILATGKTYDVRTAEQIIVTAEKVSDLAKKMNTNRKFKKITHNVTSV